LIRALLSYSQPIDTIKSTLLLRCIILWLYEVQNCGVCHAAR
jgi:hypothetical protein